MKNKFTLSIILSATIIVIAGCFFFFAKNFFQNAVLKENPQVDFSQVSDDRLLDQTSNNTYFVKKTDSGEEIWLKDKVGRESKLYTGNYIYSIKASPDDQYLAIDINGQNLIILRTSTKETIIIARKELSSNDTGDAIELLGWSDDSQYLWGGTPITEAIPDFFRFAVASNKIDKFGPLNQPIYGTDYNLNIETGNIAYSVTQPERLGLETKKFIVQLKIRNLFNDQNILVAETKSQKMDESHLPKFEPQWLDDKTLEYNNPDGSGRKSYTLPDDFSVKYFVSQIEDWSLYQEIIDPQEKNMGESCSNDEFNQFKKIVEQGSIKKFLLNGALELVITPNYDHWNNEKFLSFNASDSGAFCGAGGIYPLHAYEDKLLWTQGCSTGVMLEENQPGYESFMKCVEVEPLVNDYFKMK